LIRSKWLVAASTLALTAFASAPLSNARAAEPGGLLFRASLDHDLTAETARGQAEPIFADKVRMVADGAVGGAVAEGDEQVLAWSAPGNIQAQRGTLSFFWRSREPVGRNPFPVFRVGYPDHSSWDMAFLRVDWNGHGFDAFVTDTGLARTRVSFEMAKPPAADAWTHLAFSWDETTGVRLFVDGRPVARKEARAVYDNGLFAFGPHGRTISGLQVQSAYNFMRGGDVDEIRVYDHALADSEVAGLAAKQDLAVAAAPPRDMADAAVRDDWRLRYGFNRPDDPPPYLADPATRIRKVEFADVRDWKARFWKGSDGMRESTWPGVYNRSRLPGRNDYFQLPDWNVYAVGGKDLDLTLPDEPWNRLEVQGPADGAFTRDGAPLGVRAAGQQRTTLQFDKPLTGGKVRFDNRVQETPIQEIAAYDVTAGAEPAGVAKLAYTIRAGAASDYATLDELNAYVRGRFPADERATVVALPDGAPSTPRAVGEGGSLPLIHVLIPADFRAVRVGKPMGRFAYGWENLNAGLDGIAIDIPALKVKPTHGELFPLNIRIKDPIWPDRDLLDVNVSVKPGEARTVWLDTRDRILPNDRSLYLTLAGAGGDFDAAALDGTRIRLVFKDRKEAAKEHVADRFEQVRGNLAWFVEEQPNNRRLAVFERFDREATDLLRVDPDNMLGRIYWNEQNDEQPYPAFVQPTPPPGVPLWAFRQVEVLKKVEQFVNWWIDERQIPNGEFGGGLSDDTDLAHQWVPLALMGADVDKVTRSQNRMLEAVYANGMITDGLGTIHADELHSYEEGINAIAQGVELDWGQPKALERAMATARHYARLTEVNAAGHRHFVTNYFNATDTVREGVWEWQKPPNFLILHPGVLLAQYNGSPAVKKIILELADGYLAHGKTDTQGRFVLPLQINWRTDQGRTGGGPGGNSSLGAAQQIFWAAWRWTGDAKYLAPLASDADHGGFSGLSSLSADVVGALDKRPTWGAEMVKAASQADDYDLANTGGPGSSSQFARHVAWQVTGDKRFLEALYAREIQSDTQRMYMMTEGHLWTDRVQIPNEQLQRARLGGIGARRNQTFGGNVVAWRFAAPAKADDVAILVPDARQDRFKVIAFNLSDRPVSATLIVADITGGRWKMASGRDADGDDKIDVERSERELDLERTDELPISLAPKQATVLEFELLKAGEPSWNRPDVGIGEDDVKTSAREIAVTVHGLGAVASPAGEVVLEDAAGAPVATARFAALAAPIDLRPKTTVVRLKLAATAKPYRVRLVLDGGVREITQRNNSVMISGR
jgi:hypothetical protein